MSRKRIFEACHGALRRLQLDYLDFYFCHKFDPDTPLEETVVAMSDLVRQGKVLYWGTSGWKARRIRKAHAIASRYNLVPPAMEQPEYNLLGRKRVDREYLGLYREFGMGATTFSALASGLLSGKHTNGPLEGTRATMDDYAWLKDRILRANQEKGDQLRQLGAIAKKLNLSLAVFSLAWCLKNPRVSTVIMGASKTSQLKENVQAIEAQTRLTPEVMREVDKIVGVPKSFRRAFGMI